MNNKIFKHSKYGFSLIELLVTLAIIGILSAIAIPSYRNHVATANQSQAQAALVQLASAMEQYRNNNGSYIGAALGAAGIFPNQTPLDGGTAIYTLAIDPNTLTANTYTLFANPVAGANNDNVGFSLTEVGIKSRCQYVNNLCPAGGWVARWN